MDQIIGVFGVNWKLLVVQLFNFGLLVAILWYFLYRPVVAMIEGRRSLIEKGVADAVEAQRRLEQTEVERTALLTQATKEAEGIVENARTYGEEKGNALVKDAEARRERLLEEAAAQATEAKERAIRESKEEIARMAVLAAEKIMRERT